MQEKVLAWARGLLDKWKALTKNQKFRIISVAVILLAVLGLTVWMTLRPKMVVIYNGSTLQDAARVQSALTSAGIPSRKGGGGTSVLINQKHETNALVYLEENSVINDPGFTYQNALDFSGIGMTESVKAENFRKAAETDLANKIRRFKGVIDASVGLVTPADTNYWMAEQQLASASIILTTDGKLDAKQGEVVARFVSRCVKNLDLSRIEVYDSNYKVLFSGSMSGGDVVSTQVEAEQAMINRLENQIKRTTHLLYDETFILSSLEFDWDKLYETTLSYINPAGEGTTGLVSDESKTRQEYSGTTPDGAPGLDPNTRTIPGYAVGEQSSSAGSSQTSQTGYLYDVIQSTKDSQIGKFLKDNSSLAVFLYDYVYYDEQDMINRGLLTDTTWADFKAENSQTLPADVDVNLVNALRTGTGIQNISVLSYLKPVFVDRAQAPPRIAEFLSYGVVILLVLLLAYALIRRTKPDEITEVEPILTVEEMLVSTKQDEIVQAQAEKLREIEYGAESDVKKQINKFIQDKPEAGAQLLRNWLGEDWE